MNARTMILTTLLIGATAGCASAHPRGMAPEQRHETVRFMGYRLEVDLDDVGKPIRAQAFDREDKAVPTVIVPIQEVSICVPKPIGANGGPSPYCEPLSFLPEKISFKSGSKTLCHYYVGNQIIYYQC